MRQVYQKFAKTVLKWLIIVNAAMLQYVKCYLCTMKISWLLIIIACALALGGCHSRKAVVATSVSVPGRRPPVELPRQMPVTGTSADSNDAELVKRLISGAEKWIGTPYRYGGADRTGTDCSGFVQRLFADIAAVSLPRNSRKQAEYCRPVARELLQPGDLVFFNGSRIGGDIGHVGLYVGDSRMVHASSSRGVVVSAITDRYYAARYCGGGRVAAITYAARGTRPSGVAPELPRVSAEILVAVEGEQKAEIPQTQEVLTAEEPQPEAIVVQSPISALVDSAFAAARAAQADSVMPSWFD